MIRGFLLGTEMNIEDGDSPLFDERKIREDRWDADGKLVKPPKKNGPHLNAKEREIHREVKDREKRRNRRREKLWYNLQNRVLEQGQWWDEKALEPENVDRYRKEVNRNCGIWRQQYEG